MYTHILSLTPPFPPFFIPLFFISLVILSFNLSVDIVLLITIFCFLFLSFPLVCFAFLSFLCFFCFVFFHGPLVNEHGPRHLAIGNMSVYSEATSNYSKLLVFFRFDKKTRMDYTEMIIANSKQLKEQQDDKSLIASVITQTSGYCTLLVLDTFKIDFFSHLPYLLRHNAI